MVFSGLTRSVDLSTAMCAVLFCLPSNLWWCHANKIIWKAKHLFSRAFSQQNDAAFENPKSESICCFFFLLKRTPCSFFFSLFPLSYCVAIWAVISATDIWDDYKNPELVKKKKRSRRLLASIRLSCCVCVRTSIGSDFAEAPLWVECLHLHPVCEMNSICRVLWQRNGKEKSSECVWKVCGKKGMKRAECVQWRETFFFTVTGLVLQVSLFLIPRCVCGGKSEGAQEVGPPLDTQNAQQQSTSPSPPFGHYLATLHLFMQLPCVLCHSVLHNCMHKHTQ